MQGAMDMPSRRVTAHVDIEEEFNVLDEYLNSEVDSDGVLWMSYVY